MIKYLLLLILLLFSNNCYSQQLKKKTSGKNLGNIKKVYYVLKSNDNIKQGDYFMIAGIDTIQKGAYVNNQKSGIWNYYIGKRGEFIFDFNKHCILSDTIGKARDPLYSEGSILFNYLIWDEFDIPDEVKLLGLKGSTTIGFVVDIDGTPKDFELERGCGNLTINNESLRVIKKIALMYPWYPAIDNNGEKIKSRISRSINFEFKL
jgi:hypothetical protein